MDDGLLVIYRLLSAASAPTTQAAHEFGTISRNQSVCKRSVDFRIYLSVHLTVH